MICGYSEGTSYITIIDIYIFREGIHYSYMCCKKANHNTCIYNKPLTLDQPNDGTDMEQ